MAKVSTNVTERRLEVHERGDSHADVTEGGTGPARIGYAFNRLMGKAGFGFMLRQALRAVERRSDRVGRP